jgi:alpha/beta hydrolase fold
MPLVHDRHAPSAFHFSRALRDPADVASFLPEQTARRVAELHLRGSAGRLPTHIVWPRSGVETPPVAVLCPGGGSIGDSLEHALCAAGLLLVRVRSARSAADVSIVVEWVADHGVELGADPCRLLVAGAGRGAPMAAALAVHVRDQGWPPISLQVLVDPASARFPAEDLAQVAPAVIVGQGGKRYRERLRGRGVPVEELRALPDLVPSLRRTLR